MIAFFVVHSTGNIAVAQSIDQTQVQQRFYENPDALDPGIGSIISPQEVGPDGHNFAFCSGGTTKVNVEDLIEVQGCPDGSRQGTWASLLDLNQLQGAEVYSSDFRQIGEIVSIGEGEEGTKATILFTGDLAGPFMEGEEVQVNLDSIETDVQQSSIGDWSIVIRDSDEFLNTMSEM